MFDSVGFGRLICFKVYMELNKSSSSSTRKENLSASHGQLHLQEQVLFGGLFCIHFFAWNRQPTTAVLCNYQVFNYGISQTKRRALAVSARTSNDSHHLAGLEVYGLVIS